MNRLIVTIICLLISFILIITLILPKKEDLNLSQKKVEEKMAELRGKEEYFSNLSKISAELKNYTLNLSKIDLALPEEPDLPALFDFLQKSTSQSGLVLTGIRLSALTPPVALRERPSEFQEIKLNLGVTGSYSSFKNFLSILEKSARLIEVELISFSGAPKEESIKFDLQIKVHSY